MALDRHAKLILDLSEAAGFASPRGSPDVVALRAHEIGGGSRDPRRVHVGSMEERAVGYYLTRDAMRWFHEQSLDDPVEGVDPRSSPIRHPDLGGLPTTFVVTAEYETLRDQGTGNASQAAVRSVVA